MSDLLICGMEKPKTGRYFVAVDNTDGKDKIVISVMSEFERGDKTRPLLAVHEAVPIPGHGRLIDANKLIDRLQKQLNEAQAKVRAMGELNIGYTPDMYIVDRNRDMISILIAQAAFLPEEGTR